MTHPTIPSSPIRTSSPSPLSAIGGPAPPVTTSTPVLMQKIIPSKSAMSSVVYDARPDYHHQETSPKTVPAIKIGLHTTPPLSPVRTTQVPATCQLTSSLRKTALAGGATQPISPTRENKAYATVHEKSTPSKLQYTLGEKPTEPATPGTGLTKSTAQSDASEISKAEASFASLKLQDETSRPEWARKFPDHRAGESVLRTDSPSKVDPIPTSLELNVNNKDKLLGAVGTSSLAKSTSALIPPATPASADPVLARSAGPSSPTKTPRFTPSRPLRGLQDAVTDLYARAAGRPTNFHIRTSEGLSIPVHKENLLVFTNMLNDIPRTRKAIQIPEPAYILCELLSTCYPSIHSADTCRTGSFARRVDILLAAEKYGFLRNVGWKTTVKDFK